MSDPQITYAPHPDGTPGAELDALSWIYKHALNKVKAAEGPNPDGRDGTEVKEASADGPIIHRPG